MTNINAGVFQGCKSLTAITVDAANSIYSSVDRVLFDKGRTTLMQCPDGRAGSYAIPTSVTSIGDAAAVAGLAWDSGLAAGPRPTDLTDWVQWCVFEPDCYDNV